MLEHAERTNEQTDETDEQTNKQINTRTRAHTHTKRCTQPKPQPKAKVKVKAKSKAKSKSKSKSQRQAKAKGERQKRNKMEAKAIFRRSRSRSVQSGKQQESFASAVASFLPDPVYAKLAKERVACAGRKFSAAVLFVDVTGFSKLMNDMKSWERWSVWPRALNRFLEVSSPEPRRCGEQSSTSLRAIV